MVCDVALADFFSDVAPVCLIIASIVPLITVYLFRTNLESARRAAAARPHHGMSERLVFHWPDLCSTPHTSRRVPLRLSVGRPVGTTRTLQGLGDAPRACYPPVPQ